MKKEINVITIESEISCNSLLEALVKEILGQKHIELR